MNKVILMGRLTKDPEVRYSNGNAVAKFSLAVDRRIKNKDGKDADFFSCTAFGKQAEFVEKYLKQGTKILTTGRLQNDNYTDKDGNKRSTIQVICEELEFAESKKKNDEIEVKIPDGGFAPIQQGEDESLPFAF